MRLNDMLFNIIYKKTTTKKGSSFAINQTMIIVMAVLILVLIASFYILLGERAKDYLSKVFSFTEPEVE